MIDLKVTFKGLEKAKRDLETYARKAIPYAAKDALNSAAFEARRQWQGEIKRAFTLRNQFTAGKALVVERAQGLDMRRMVAVLGSTAPYMSLQESGGTTQGAIPGPVAAGQAPGGNRTRLVRAGNKLSAINVRKPRGKSKAQRNAVAIHYAKKSGKKHALLERPGGGKGLFLVGGGKRRTTTKLLWAVGRGTSRVPPHPTLGSALAKTEKRFGSIMHDAVLRQLKHHRVFGY